MIGQHLIEELQTILKKDYEKDLELVEVSEIAEKLVNYFGLLAQIENKNSKKDSNHEIFKKTI